MRRIVCGAVIAGLVLWLPAFARNVSKRSSTYQIYRSTNNGESWEASKAGPPLSKRVNTLAMDVERSYAGTDEGIFVSSDNGESWSRAALGPSHRVQSLLVAQGAVYAGTDRGVYVSRNNGKAWEPVVRGLEDLNVRALATDGMVILAGTDKRGVFALTEGGHWLKCGNGLPSQSQVFDLAATPSHIYAALYGKGLYRRSRNSDWEKIGEVRPLEVIAHGDVIVIGHNPGGIQQSVDGGRTWKMATGLSGPAPI